jgi:hypothetical protein
MRLKNVLAFSLIFFVTLNLKANEARSWLNIEIDKIIYSYQNIDLPNENIFLMIE